MFEMLDMGAHRCLQMDKEEDIMSTHVRVTKEAWAIMSGDEIIDTYDEREKAVEATRKFFTESFYDIRKLTITWEEER